MEYLPLLPQVNSSYEYTEKNVIPDNCAVLSEGEVIFIPGNSTQHRLAGFKGIDIHHSPQITNNGAFKKAQKAITALCSRCINNGLICEPIATSYTNSSETAGIVVPDTSRETRRFQSLHKQANEFVDFATSHFDLNTFGANNAAEIILELCGLESNWQLESALAESILILKMIQPNGNLSTQAKKTGLTHQHIFNLSYIGTNPELEHNDVIVIPGLISVNQQHIQITIPEDDFKNKLVFASTIGS